jgi:hypothetical protein
MDAERPRVPQMALHRCVVLVPETEATPQVTALVSSERLGNTLIPHISEVLTGIAKRIPALVSGNGIIGFISDVCRVFMSFSSFYCSP